MGHHYLTMELVEGTTLEARLASGPLPLERTLQIAAQIASALEAAHDENVLHRDLKPGNIMLTEDGRVKVLDFGLARPVRENEEPLLSHESTTPAALTAEGTVLGNAYEFPRISPDGTRAAAAVHMPAGTHDVWLVDLRRGTQSPLTSDGNYIQPTWTPDGSRLTFSSVVPGGANLAWVPADGSAPVELILERPGRQDPYSWRGDGETLAFIDLDPVDSYDIWTLRDGSATKVMGRRFVDTAPAFSPDGMWLAYVSNEIVTRYTCAHSREREGRGKSPSMVAPSPSGLGTVKPCTTGRTGKCGPSVSRPRTDSSSAEPRLLFERRYEAMAATARPFYDVAADGRLLMVQK